MKVLMIHVGNEVQQSDHLHSAYYLKRKSLIDGQLKTFLKHDIVNADIQMESLINKGVEVEYGHISDRKSIKSLWKAGIQIRELSGQKDINLVHVLWGSSTAIITLIFSRKPVIISFCGSDLMGATDAQGKMTMGGRVSRFFSRIAAYFANHIVLKSKAMLTDVPKLARKKVSVVPNGLNTTQFYPLKREDARDKLGWDLDKKYILFFYTEGQVVKNREMAKEVVDYVKSKRLDVDWVVATKIPHQELPYYYNAADVMILTSYHEGSNNSLKEANACNTPIVSVKVGDAYERLNGVKNSFVMDTYDVPLFAEKVLEVLTSGNRSNGVFDAEKVSLEKIAERLIEIYKRVQKA